MTDATLPALSESSMANEARSTHSSNSNSSENDAYPFIVHSQQSVTNGDPPEVDSGKLVRKNRKRTSAEDQAILEAEYNCNPKPDKAARMEIVKQVSLTEKEVQIWFQNRRQNTRRKSRPLLPHEIAAFGLGGMAVLSPSPTLSNPVVHHQGADQMGTITQTEKEGNVQDLSELQKDSPQNLQDSPILSFPFNTESGPNSSLDSSKPSTRSPKSLPDQELQSKVLGTEFVALSQPPALSTSLPATLGYLSNRRNASVNSLNTPSSQSYKFSYDASSTILAPSSCPERSTVSDSSVPPCSQVRLSLSIDGKAELVSSEVSPPRPQQPRPSAPMSTTPQMRQGGLKRSQSAALPFVHVAQRFSSNLATAPRLRSGRSRDSRTWEFCCDTEAKDELTTQAENESSGSAVAAISLLRSTSNSNLKSNINKRNAPVPKVESKQGKRPKLGRASSSLARLQYNGKNLTLSPSGDSDKENWLPGEDSGNTELRSGLARRQQRQNQRHVLVDSSTSKTHIPAFLKQKAVQQKSTLTQAGILEDTDVKRRSDPEVERFMRGEVSPSKKGDLDCIQGLLSLSQGTWR